MFAHLDNSYHGDTVGSVSVGGMDLFHRVYKNLLFKTIGIDLPSSYRYEGSIEEWKNACFKALEDTFIKHSDSLAGVIVEPLIQGAAGMLLCPDGYLKKLRELCDQYDVLMIVDEVATGFLRVGTMFACDKEHVSPDIFLIAKGLTGGYLPISATVTNNKVYEAFYDDYKTCKTFFHGHTYTGNPLGCRVALASLALIEENKLEEHVKELILLLQERLKDFLLLSNVGDIRQRGMMVGIELVADKINKIAYDWELKQGIKVILEARKRGVILRPLGNVIVLMPPLAISKEELNFLLDVTYESILAVGC